MNYWKVILATIVIYGAGVMSGGLLVNDIVRPHPRFPHRPEGFGAFGGPSFPTNGSGRPMFRGPRQPETMSRQFLQQLDERLHLTSEQRDAIQKIITEGQNQMRKTMQDTRLEIRGQLTPEQQSRFDELVKRPMHRPFFTNPPFARPPTETRPTAPKKAPGA